MSTHLETGFGPLDLDGLDSRTHKAAAEHLDTCETCERVYRASAEALAAVASALPPVAPSPALWPRVLQAISTANRFNALVQRAAELTDMGIERMRDLLHRIDDAAGWVPSHLPSVSLFHLDGGPAVASAVVGFIKIPAGGEFPQHSHRGREASLILQGSCRESDGTISRRGDLVWRNEEVAHSVTALPGPDLIFLVVAFGGIEIGGEILLPGDPRL